MTEDEQRSIHARIAALTRAAQTDGSVISAPARAKFLENFETEHKCRLCGTVTINQSLSPQQRLRAVEAARRAHFSRLALARYRGQDDATE